MRRTPLLVSFSFALLLAACGGGGGGTGNVMPSGGGGATPTPTPHPTATPTPTPTPSPIPGAGQALKGPQQDANGDWGPPGVAAAADFPVQHGFDGTGQTIAVVIDSDVNRNDLAAFFQYFQIPTTSRTIVTKAVAPLAAPGIVAGGAQDEATLDVETLAGLAPGANIVIYQIKDLSDANINNAYTQILNDKKAYVLNSSFGGCEMGTAALEDPVVAQLAAAGVAMTASGGDDGNECQTTPSVVIAGSWPATNPHVIGVGGTETDESTGYALTSNAVWNDKTCGVGTQCGGGGGLSTYYPTPSYQLGLAGIASSTWRNTPDISYPAESVGMYENGKWVDLNGTSWSAPEAAALLAEVYQYCGANGGAISGVTDPVTIPYYVYGKSPAAFIDVVHGSDRMGTTTPYYNAAPGYDDASGFGVPLGYAFAQTACPNHIPASGMIGRSSMSRFSSESTVVAHTGAYTVDVTPRVAGISDEGVRGAQEPTQIQVVVQPGGNIAESEAGVVSALQNAGFRITQRFPDHLVVDAVAPSATVEQFFRTRMHDISQGAYGTRYLPATQIVVPASIASFTARVSLDDVVTRHHRTLSDHTLAP